MEAALKNWRDGKQGYADVRDLLHAVLLQRDDEMVRLVMLMVADWARKKALGV